MKIYNYISTAMLGRCIFKTQVLTSFTADNCKQSQVYAPDQVHININHCQSTLDPRVGIACLGKHIQGVESTGTVEDAISSILWGF